MRKILQKIFFNLMYFKNPPWDTYQTPPEVYDFINRNPPGRALDLGCGTGTNVITLAKNGWQVTGIDFIPKAIRNARHRAVKEQVVADFRVGDVTRLDGIEGYFDLILDIGCYHSLNPSGMQAYRDNIKQLLLPGGTYLIYLFFRTEDGLADTGALETDLDPFLDFLELVHRQDGTERGTRKSSWLTFRKPL